MILNLINITQLEQKKSSMSLENWSIKLGFSSFELENKNKLSTSLIKLTKI